MTCPLCGKEILDGPRQEWCEGFNEDAWVCAGCGELYGEFDPRLNLQGSLEDLT